MAQLRFAGLVAASVVALLGVGEVHAQDALVTSPGLITQCLCGAQHVQTLQSQMTASRREFDDAQSRVTILRQQIDQSRPTVNPDDTQQMDAFRRLLDAEQAAQMAFFDIVQPRTQRNTLRYNEAVESYNRQCTGLVFDSSALAQVKASLVCPAEKSD